MPKNLAEVQAELTRIAAYARDLVGQALSRGTITKDQHDGYVRNLTESGGVTRVLIELELEDADKIARTDLDEQVERVLAQLALIGGARVVPNSTKVTLDAINPATDDGYEEPFIADDDEGSDEFDPADVTPEAPGSVVTITTRLSPGATLPAVNGQLDQAVEGVLTTLGARHGITMLRGTTQVRVNDRDVTITHRATGNVALADRGADEVESVLAQLARNYDVRLAVGSTRVSV